ncbi:MAG: hypothetical protein M1826_005916 [Phylliscum demangeonii]|nr:MAG: hypothetical protein M1826_005916 [Phylliscum demangeonii]
MSGGWNTIESDAGVFTYLVEKLGVKDVQFEELVALDAELLQQNRHVIPVYGVIFLFKWVNSGETASGSPADGAFDFEAADRLFFARQTITNACGTQALLSVLLNHDGGLDLGPHLRDFKAFADGLPPDMRGEALSNSELIRDVHNSFARSSPFFDERQQQRPAGSSADDDDDGANAVYHFIAYTAVHGQLYELDGLQPAPIAHGACPSLAAFPDRVIPVLRRRIARYPAHEIRFNLLAVVRDGRLQARERGDAQLLYEEELRRTAWRRENALRRHNFVAFIGELLQVVVRAKVEEGEPGYEQWVRDATAVAKDRLRERKAAKASG